MQVIRKEYSIPSSSGIANLFIRSWEPDEGIKGVVQLIHGMAEHGERYEDMANYFCGKGLAFICDDHIGHGKSVNSDDDLGYFGEKNGYNALIEDERAVTDLVKENFKGLPIIIFGHSMGSFMAREYIRRYGTDSDIKGAIICGTSGKNPATPIAVALAASIAKAKGGRYKSKFIDNLAFGTYNKKIENPRTPFDWLSTDDEQVDKYVADDYCGFLFSAAGFRDLFTILNMVSGKAWYKGVNKDLPILLTAGQNDPVGAYSKGVHQVFNDLKAAGVKDVVIKIYPGMRHEIHNEKEVYADLAAWSLNKIEK